MRTVRHIRQELYVRLGFVNQAAAAGNLRTIINSFVNEAQGDIYWMHGFENTRLESTFNTVLNQTLYDWPTKVDPKRRININVKIDNDVWLPLSGPGIESTHDTYADVGTAYPIRYDAHSQIELWPKPSGVYPVRIEHFARLGLFLEPDEWTGATTYKVGDFVLPTNLIDWPNPLPETVDKNHFVYEVTTAGTSHATIEPTWPIVEGSTVNDNGVVFTARLNTNTVPDELIFRLATFKSKLHYRQPDAESSFSAFQSLLMKMKSGDITGRRYLKGDTQSNSSNQDPPWIPPKRV